MGKQVSVIVPAYNAEKYIDKCIQSILLQTYPDVETIVVYDESSDRTINHLKEYEQSIILIEQGKTNPSIARNVGLKIAKGSYVAFCDADDYWAHTKLEEQVTFLEHHPEIGLCYTNIFSIDNSGEVLGRYVFPQWDQRQYLRGLARNRPSFALSSVMARRRLLDEIGHFDKYFGVCEDLEIYLRLCKVTSFANLNLFLTYRREHGKQLVKDEYKMTQGRAQVFRKHHMHMRFVKSMFGVSLYSFLRFLPGVYRSLAQRLTQNKNLKRLELFF